MALLSRDDILSVRDLTFAVVPVPEWGGEVRLRTLSGKERDHFEQSLVKTKGNKQVSNYDNARARLVALCMVDDSGRRLFNSTKEIEMLGDKSVAALQVVYNKCMEMNKLTEQEVEELTEDFDGEADENSTSD